MNVHAQPQPAFDDFIPRFLGLLFDEGDRVVVCRLPPGGVWADESLPRHAAWDWLSDRRDEPNLYFRASSHDGASNYGKGNCIAARALFVDIDYGEIGHKKPSPFDTFEETMAYLLTAPVRPSIAWHTGHGIQAAYLLREPFRFGSEAEKAGLIERYEAVGRRLAEMLRADAAFTPERAYRVPLTLNCKEGTPEVRGDLLYDDTGVRYDFAELERRCAGYGIDSLVRLEDAKANANAAAAAAAAADAPDTLTVKYEELPADLRAEIEGGGERSERLFGIIGRMVRGGYSDACILSAAAHGDAFVKKYGSRRDGLAGEVATCLGKIRHDRRVYPASDAPPFQVCNLPVRVPLSECGPLDPDLDGMIDRYERAIGKTLAARVRDAARFHEHAFQTYDSGVLESPCGAGKSVWALCRTALRASAADRHLYVVETVEALYRAADMLEKLTGAPVGRIHGFREDKCLELCGEVHTWSECSLSNKRSPCHSCEARMRCAFFTRREQLKRQILCLTHNGFVGMLERDDAVLRDATVIIDEDLSRFNSLRLSSDELERLAGHFGRGHVAAFFPCTSFARADELNEWGTGPRTKSFAACNYLYCDRSETAALGAAYSNLREAFLRMPHVSLSEVKARERAEDTIMLLLNFFRPNACGDATYAYREGIDKEGHRSVQALRSRFDFGTGRSYRRIWILNASAQLSPHPYPDNLPVFACPELQGNSGLLRLHVVRGNPTKKREAAAVRLSEAPLRFGVLKPHEKVLLAFDKHSAEEGNVRDLLRRTWNMQHLPEEEGGGPEIVDLRRGQIKGVNNAGDCTLALLTAMATFTGIDDCALHAAMHYRRTFPDTPHVFTPSGDPNWPGGKMKLPAMRTYYALRSLDELYQAIWRTAVRNDRPVDAVVALPDEHWLAALYRTVMPEMCVASAWTEITKKEKAAEKKGEKQETAGSNETGAYDFRRDDHMYGAAGLLSMPPGEEVEKKEIAARLGYSGKDPWEKNKPRIMALLGDFFEDGSTVNTLRRKARNGLQEKAAEKRLTGAQTDAHLAPPA